MKTAVRQKYQLTSVITGQAFPPRGQGTVEMHAYVVAAFLCCVPALLLAVSTGFFLSILRYQWYSNTRQDIAGELLNMAL